jgi:hypothetical protein
MPSWRRAYIEWGQSADTEKDVPVRTSEHFKYLFTPIDNPFLDSKIRDRIARLINKAAQKSKAGDRRR